MENKYIIGGSIVAIAIIAFVIISLGSANSVTGKISECAVSEMNYYYRSDCSHCMQVAKDKSIEKLGELGVKVNKYEVIQWGMYGIRATPTFEIDFQKTSGYRTFEQLKELLGCK